MVTREIKTVEGVVWIGFGIVVCVLAWGFDLGSIREPGAGSIAFLCGLSLCAIGSVMVISRVFSKKPPAGSKGPGMVQFISQPRLLYVLGLLLGYILFLNMLGYIVVTFLLMWGVAFDWDKKNVASSLLFAAITVAVSYLMFQIWLRTQLPRGIFPWW
jgi:hypothetical protein